MAVFEKMQRIVVERLGVSEEEVTIEAKFKDDLGADSLDVVELVMEIEDEFQIEVSDDIAETLQTVGDAVKFIESQI